MDLLKSATPANFVDYWLGGFVCVLNMAEMSAQPVHAITNKINYKQDAIFKTAVNCQN